MRTSVLLILAVLSAAPAMAQDNSLIIDRSRSDRAAPPAAHRGSRLPRPKPKAEVGTVTPFVLTAVRIEGSSLTPDALGAATKPFIGQTIDAKAIDTLAAAVSAAYAGQGDVALYTVTVPAQDFAGGVLRVVVTEGYIQHVDVSGDVDGDVSRVVSLAQRLTVEHPLKRSTLERYLSLIRDLPGLTVDADLIAGDAPGATRLELVLHQRDYKLAFTLNDAGNALLGHVQGQADLSLYNLLREGEETTASFGTSTLFNRYQYYAVSHSEALDDEGTRAGISYAYLHTKIPLFAVGGEAQTFGLAVSHPFIRSYDENLSASLSLDGINSRNALLGTILADENVRSVRLNAGYSLVDPKSTLALAASMSFGIDGLDAHEAVPGIADLDYKKFVFQARYERNLGEEWIVRSHGLAQIAFDRLPVSELYALGGPDYGRAFLQATALGDSALAGSLELGVAPAILSDIAKGTEIFGFVDAGRTWYRARLATPGVDYHLASAGLGVRFPIGTKTKIELEGADAIDTNVPFTHVGDWRFLFGITISN